MDWKSLYSIFNGLLGKCLIFIALSTPVSILVKKFDILPWTFLISLIGAIVILVGFVLSLAFTPPLVKKFSDAHEYADYLLAIKEGVDINLEFLILDQMKDQLPKKINDYSLERYKFVSIEKTISVNNNKALRILSIVKYSYYLQQNKTLRIILTLILAIGSLLIFFPTLNNIYTILISAANV